MCRLEKSERKREMGSGLVKGGVEKHLKSSSSRMKLWMIRATTSVLLWTCIVQLTAIGETWGPRVLTVWPPCFNRESDSASAVVQDKVPAVPARVLPPKSQSTCYLFLFYLNFSCNFGLGILGIKNFLRNHHDFLKRIYFCLFCLMKMIAGCVSYA